MNKLSSFWILDLENEIFATLKAAKYHVWVAYTDNERIKYLQGSFIRHVAKDDLISQVKITIDDNGKASFSRPIKIQ